MPFTFANSWSFTISWSRFANAIVCDVGEVGLDGVDFPRRASREYVKPLTCSTRRPSTVPKCKTRPSAGETYHQESFDFFALHAASRIN